MAITIRGAINPTSVSVPTSHLAEILEGGGEPTDSFTVTKNLTHAVIKNERISGSSYYAEVEPAENWSDLSVTIKVGGVDMSNLYTSGVINIPNVTGNIVITAAAAQAALVSITAVYTQSGTVYDTDTLDSLKSDLVVTATYADSSTATVTDYTLSGTLAEGTSTITVSYGGKTATIGVVVTLAPLYQLESPITSSSKSLLGVDPFASGSPITILFEFTVPAGGTVTNGARLFGLNTMWRFDMGSMWAASTDGGSTSAGIWFYTGTYGVKIGSTSVLVKDTIYRLAVTYNPTTMLANVYFKGGSVDVSGTIQRTTELTSGEEIGFNTGSQTKQFTAQKFDIYKTILSSSEITAFLNGA